MRVLIISVTAGYGHNSTAQALRQELEDRGVTVLVEDMYQKVSQTMYDIVDKGYLFSVKHMKRQYDTTYRYLEHHEGMRRFLGALDGSELYARRYSTSIDEFAPDVIISTHVFSAQLLNTLKRRRYISTPVIGIVTDYCIHPFWEETQHIENIVTASELITLTAVRRGVRKAQILPMGIPVRKQFREKTDKAQARKALGLHEDRHTVLFMGGSMGYGNMLSAVSSADSLNMGLQLVCICGNNDKLRYRLEYLKVNSGITVVGFTDRVGLYMDASDCIITKPGGLTSTEALNKRLPLIVMDPIPGHEERNADFFTNNGCAMRITKNFSVAEALYYLFTRPERLELMRRSIDLIAHPDACEKICDRVMEMGIRE